MIIVSTQAEMTQLAELLLKKYLANLPSSDPCNCSGNNNSGATVKNIQYKPPEFIQVDNELGLVSNTTTFIFDGSSGKKNWIGWEFRPNRIGQGPMKKGIDYNWDIATGYFTLLVSGDKFQPDEFFYCEFDLIVS